MEADPPGGKVCVVAAPSAWSFYRLASAFICQPGRSLQDAEWLGFYSGQAIQPAVARILVVFSPVELTVETAAEWALSVDPLRRQARVARAPPEARRGALAVVVCVSDELERRIADSCGDAIDGYRGVEGLDRLALFVRPHATEKITHRYAVERVAILGADVDGDDIES